MIHSSSPAPGVVLCTIDRQERRNALDTEHCLALSAAWASSDFAEGVAAFREKRPPEFEGR